MKTFSDAQLYCESMGANLASIHNEEEQYFIKGKGYRHDIYHARGTSMSEWTRM